MHAEHGDTDLTSRVCSMQVLEHVSRPFMKNYQAAFHKAALIFVTHAATGGWHHTEVHREDWCVLLRLLFSQLGCTPMNSPVGSATQPLCVSLSGGSVDETAAPG